MSSVNKQSTSDSAVMFRPLRLREVTLPNRLGMSPMCQYSAEEGKANDWHLVHYGARAAGGLGIIYVEATAVDRDGRITPRDLGLWNDEQIGPLRNIASFIQSTGCVPAIQLAHAGRKASCAIPSAGGLGLSASDGGWQPVGPSPCSFSPNNPMPRELSSIEIEQIIIKFALAARRAVDAGFRVVMIHSAHGYLLHEFLSPISNLREDEYGGSFENRTRLLRLVTAAVREVLPVEYPLVVRLSTTDWVEGGWSIGQSVELCKILRELGVDMVDCSSGFVVPNESIPFKASFQVPFAQKIKAETGILTSAVGLITEVDQAEDVLSSGSADLVLLGRELMREPYFAFKAARHLGCELNVPVQYARAFM